MRRLYQSIISTTVSTTAVLIQSVHGEQKLQAADFRSLGNVLLLSSFPGIRMDQEKKIQDRPVMYHPHQINLD